MRHTTRFIYTLVSVALLSICGGSLMAQPNIVFLLADDYRYDCLAAGGNLKVLTPVLNGLWNESLVFRQATSSCPICAPCRATILTGVMPWKHGQLGNTARLPSMTRSGFSVPETLPKLIRDAGYHTALVGKWHVWPDPWQVGFEEVRLWSPDGSELYLNPTLAQGNSRTQSIRSGYTATLYTDNALAFLQQAHTEPFFLWLAYNTPHAPMKPVPTGTPSYGTVNPNTLAPPGYPPGYLPTNSTNWRLYYKAISHMDAEIGRVLAALDALGLRENTLVIFASEQGLMQGSHGYAKKGQPYDEALRANWLIRGPGVVPRVSNTQAEYTDLARSLVEWTGGTVPATWHGRSLTPELGGTPTLYDISFSGMASIDSGAGITAQWRAARTATAKYAVRNPAGGLVYELYDLVLDPFELTNQAENPLYAGIKADLHSRLKLWQLETGDSATWP